MGAMILHGTQAGMFSPIAPYGVLLPTLLPGVDELYNPVLMFSLVILFHLVVAVAAFVLFGGMKLAGQKVDDSVIKQLADEAGPFTRIHAVTLACFIGLVASAVTLDLSLGVVALVLGLILVCLRPKEDRSTILNHLPWAVIVIICGVLTYVTVLEEAGAIEWLAGQVRAFASPAAAALVMNVLAGIVTALASTFGTFGILIPLAEPFIEAGELSPTLLLAAMASSAAVTDISPFSPLGALFLAANDKSEQAGLMRQMIRYVLILVVAVPTFTWMCLILPGW